MCVLCHIVLNIRPFSFIFIHEIKYMSDQCLPCLIQRSTMCALTQYTCHQYDFAYLFLYVQCKQKLTLYFAFMHLCSKDGHLLNCNEVHSTTCSVRFLKIFKKELTVTWSITCCQHCSVTYGFKHWYNPCNIRWNTK